MKKKRMASYLKNNLFAFGSHMTRVLRDLILSRNATDSVARPDGCKEVYLTSKTQ